MRPRTQYQLEGTGPVGSVCLLLFGHMGQSCGIGDDIAILPIVAELCKEHAVTIYTVHPEIFARIGATVYSVDANLERASDGGLFDMLWDGEHLPLYERIFKLGGAGLWQELEIMEKAPSRWSQFAEILGVDVPEDFDYIAALDPQTTLGGYTILASESTEIWRTLPMVRAKEIYDALSEDGVCVWLGIRKVAHTWAELLSLVYNADRVVAVDAGIAHIAAALKKPLVVLGGVTDARNIYSMYGGETYYLQGVWGGCLAPCYRSPSRGFHGGKCCKSYSRPKCMESINSSQVLSLIQGVNHASS